MCPEVNNPDRPDFLYLIFLLLKFIIMKKILLFALITAMVSSATLAQDQKTVKQDKTEWEKKLKEELKLTDEQTVKYDALNKEYNDKISALMSDASLAEDAKKEKKMAL